MIYPFRNSGPMVRQARSLRKKRLLNACACILMACLAGVLPLAVGHSAADVVAQAMSQETRHDMLITGSEDHAHDHGHGHADSDSDERLPGHFHGHNPLDHSHETPSVFAVLGLSGPVIFPVWNAAPVFAAIHGPPHPIERPPRNV